MKETLRVSAVVVGTELAPLVIEATPTFVVSTAIATRDFQDVHHDRDSALARGSKDIFLNILTDTGLVQRFVTDWAGPEALVRSVKIKLGVPCYAYDTITFSGRVIDRIEVDGERRFVVEVTGRDSLGDHVNGSVQIVLPEEEES
ncbi:MAG: MaoC family dehydratase [Pseudonocardiaceae bacterium]